MMLIVSPRALSTQIEVRIDSGIEIAMMRVLRQLPRNSRIMAAVRQAARIASRTTPFTAARTNTDWSAIGSILSAGGSAAATCGNASRTCCTMSRVEAAPTFITVKSDPRMPSRRTMLVCGVKPSRTCATSRM